MVENTLSLSNPDVQMEDSIIVDHQPSIRESDPIASASQEHQSKLPLSYLSLSVGDHRHFGLSDFQDPLFYQQPLHLHCNQPIPSTTRLEHETGDRVRTANNFQSNEYRKQRSSTSRKHSIEKTKSSHRAKKSKKRMVKTKEKKKKTSKKNLNKRKQKSKIINRSSMQRLQSQSKTPLQAISLKKKEKFCIASKKRSLLKVNKDKSSTSSQYVRKLNATNNRVASTIPPRRSLRLGAITTRPLSVVRLMENPNMQITLNKLKQQANVSIFDPISQSNSKQLINETKQTPHTSNNIISSNVSLTNTLEQKPLQKSLCRGKENGKKLSRSKSKRIRTRAKLSIRSPVHTTFKKAVRHCRKRRTVRRKIKYPRCTSSTLITIRPSKTNDENIIKRMDVKNDDICAKISASLFSLKNNLTNRQSAIALPKNCAQLTSKNNNRRMMKTNRCPSKRKSKKSIRR